MKRPHSRSSRFSRIERQGKKIMEGCSLCARSRRRVLELVASRRRYCARLLAGSHAIFHRTLFPQGYFKLLSILLYHFDSFTKIIHWIFENDVRYCIKFITKIYNDDNNIINTVANFHISLIQCYTFFILRSYFCSYFFVLFQEVICILVLIAYALWCYN